MRVAAGWLRGPWRWRAAAAAIVIGLAAVLVYRAVAPQPESLTQGDVDAAVERILASVTPAPSLATLAFAAVYRSVVRINVELPAKGDPSHPGIGSGVVIDEAGIILTSNHVIQGALKIQVVFSDGSESDAMVLLQQPENDLAVLRAALVPDDLVAATLVSTATLNIGDDVVAVGSPYGLTSSVSAGVVSGLGRAFRAPGMEKPMVNMIQFDAAVNPGNSGGPLVNRAGDVVGIVTGLLNPSQEVFIGIGFATPIEATGGAAGPPWD